MISDQNIDLLILEHFNGKLPLQGEEELRTWIEQSKENKNYYTTTIAYLETAASMGNLQPFEADKAWQRLRRKINPQQIRRKLILELGKIAAVFLLAFLFGYLLNDSPQKTFRNKEADVVMTEVPYGSKSVISLPDGSRVWINAGSKISYSASFSNRNRSVVLEGEAYFDVVSDPGNPFLVESSGIKVKATGTQFNVRAYPDEGFIETTLVEGKISVTRDGAASAKKFSLQPNQKLTIYKEQAPGHAQKQEKRTTDSRLCEEPAGQKQGVKLESDVSTNVYTSWKDKEWIIYKEKFSSLARKLEKRYDVRITFKDELISDFSYTGTLQDENLKEVLDVISLTSPVDYKLENKNVTIWYKNSSNKVLK